MLLVLLTTSASNGKFQKDRMQFNGFSSRISLRLSHVISTDLHSSLLLHETEKSLSIYLRPICFKTV